MTAFSNLDRKFTMVTSLNPWHIPDLGHWGAKAPCWPPNIQKEYFLLLTMRDLYQEGIEI